MQNNINMPGTEMHINKYNIIIIYHLLKVGIHLSINQGSLQHILRNL